jgi:hypothetical protein
MSEQNPEAGIPEDEEEVIEIAEAETEQERNLAVTQAELIGDL